MAVTLEEFKVTGHQSVEGLYGRINAWKRSLANAVVEKQGSHWALTSFVIGVWDQTERQD